MKQKSEAKIQQEIVQYFRANYYQKGVIFAVPNEAWAKMGINKAVMYKVFKTLQLTGMLSGVSDLVVALKGKVIFVEVKDHKGTQKPKQIIFQQNIENLGLQYHLVRSLEDFIKIIS
jgi:hypothetical protein